MLDQSLPATGWVQLHTANPTDAGTSAVSSETTRKQFTIADAGSGVAAGTGSTVSWAPISLSGTENLTHYSVWTASTGGILFSYGELTTPRNGVNNGDTVNFTPSDFTFAINDP